MYNSFGVIVLVVAWQYVGMIQLENMPKLTSIFAAKKAFSQKLLKQLFWPKLMVFSH